MFAPAAPSGVPSTESLEVRVICAMGISPDKAQDFDAYVKVEMRGQDGLVKARTAAGKWIGDGNMKFDETLRLPIPVGAEEIRLKICKDKKRVFLSGSNVMSNAGIYLRDLLRFVPIEKEFGLFRPTDKTPGGTIKMFFDYKPNTPADAPEPAAPSTDKADTPTPTGGYAHTTTSPQEIPAPTTSAATMSQVKSQVVVEPAKTVAPPVTITVAAAASAAKAAPPAAASKKGGFPILGLLVVIVGAGFGVHLHQQQKPMAKPFKKK